jgi:hypothetical protein
MVADARTIQKINMNLSDLAGFEFDGTNRLFACPIGYERQCICDVHSCVYYGPRGDTVGTCAVPFIHGFLTTLPVH